MPETPEQTTVYDHKNAPRPWRITNPNKHYFQIVDAAGLPICDFFPEAAQSRGRGVTFNIAEQIVRWANSPALVRESAE